MQEPHNPVEPLSSSYEYVNGALCRVVFEDEPWGRGRGTFHWPGGMVYEGEFMGLQRHGKGRQRWPDHSVYEGDFVNDLRQGKGRHCWKNGEFYEGDYWQDKRHGSGTYSWPSGSTFKGNFVQDVKEGFGVFTAATGEKFKGHYHQDIRCGDGVIYYSKYHQDVGTWRGAHLVQLKFSVPDASFDPLCIVKGNLGSLDTPNYHQTRGVTGEKGPLEVASEELIQIARLGQHAKVLSMLQAGAVYPDVMDANRHTPLFAAATHGQLEVLNLLLDHGANVNQLNWATISPLTACLHLLYASSPKVLLLLKKKYGLLERGQSQPGSAVSEYSLYSSDLDLSPAAHSHDPANTDEEEENDDSDVVAVSHLPGKGSIRRENQKECNTTESGQVANDIVPVAHLQDGGHTKETIKQNCDDLQWTSTPTDLRGIPTLTNKEVPQSWASVHEGSDMYSPLQDTPDQDIQSEAPEAISLRHLHHEVISAGGSTPITSNTITPSSDINQSSTPTTLPDKHFTDDRLSSADESAKPLELKTCQQILPLENESVECQKPLPLISQTNDEPKSQQTSPHWSPDSLPPSPKNDTGLQNLTPFSGTSANCSDDDSESRILPSRSHSMLQMADPSHLHADSLRKGSQSCPPIDLQGEESVVSLTTPCLSRPPSRYKNQHNLAYPSSQFGPVLSAAESVSFSCTSVSTGLPSWVGSEKQELPRSLLRDTVLLLLHRGADPNLSQQPLPALFYAILAEDKELVVQMLDKGASLQSHLPLKLGGLLPLHAATSLGSVTGVEITKILLESGAELKTLTATSTGSLEQGEADDQGKDGGTVGEGWTPLHLACATRRDMDQDAVLKMVRLLVREGANINEVISSHSPLSLAILHGHDRVVDYLLTVGADPNLPLGHLASNALCCTTTHTAHRNRDFAASVKLVQKLLSEGAQLLRLVELANSNQKGTVVDFSYDAFNQDRRLSQLRYVALTRAERVRYKSARRLTKYLLCLMRIKAVDNVPGLEKQLTELLLDSSPKRLMIGTNSSVTPRLYTPGFQGKRRSLNAKNKQTHPLIPAFTLRASLIYVAHLHGLTNQHLGKREDSAAISEYLHSVTSLLASSTAPANWSLHSFCYECGRSSSWVRLTQCSGCRMVSYCSQVCKDSGWRAGHRMECSGAPSTASSKTSSPVHTKVIQREMKRIRQKKAKTHAGGHLTPLALSRDRGHSRTAPPLSSPSYAHHTVSSYHKNITRIAVKNVREATMASHYRHLQEILEETIQN